MPSLGFPARKHHFISVSNHCCFIGISKHFTQSLCLSTGQRHKDRNEQPGTGDPQRPSSHTILPGLVSSSAQLSRQSFHPPALIPSTFQSLPEHPPSLFLFPEIHFGQWCGLTPAGTSVLHSCSLTAGWEENWEGRSGKTRGLRQFNR